jgi:CubicO group peptidase (beta-lactamase class C family)
MAIALAAAALSSGTSQESAQTRSGDPWPGPTIAQAIDRQFAPFDAADTPGYAVGVVRDGRLVHARGFGSADLDHGVAIGPRSVFNVASLSKQFTAAAVALLIRQGKVSLDHEVRRYLPEFPAYPGPIRVAHLAYMTSGLKEYYQLPRPNGQTWDRDVFTVADAIRATLSQPEPDFAPGSRWAYSNVNYMLLAEIVSRVSGEPFPRYVERHIFTPLGMTRSHVDDDLSRVVPGRVTGYNRRESGGYRRELRLSPHYGGSGVFTTLEDLARWDHALDQHKLDGPELTRLLLSTRRFEHDKTNDAFGLVWGEQRGRRTLWYEGGDAGFSSCMIRFPDDRFTVIVLSNLGSGEAARYARRIADLLLGAAA